MLSKANKSMSHSIASNLYIYTYALLPDNYVQSPIYSRDTPMKQRRTLFLFIYLICIIGFSNAQYLSDIIITSGTSTVVEGTSHTLTCTVSEGPFTQIFWYFDDEIITDSDTQYLISSNTLLIPQFSPSEEGAYTCVAENSYGKIVSSALELKLAYFSVDIEKLPDTIVISPNSSFSLNCPLYAINSHPRPTVTWIHNNVLLQESYPLVISLDDELVFILVSPSQNGVYFCRATNSFLNVTEEFNIAAISIPDTQVDSRNSEFYISPENKTVTLGDDVSFQCIITESSLNAPAIWSFGDTRLIESDRILLTQSSVILTIRSLMLQDMGLYSCTNADNQLDSRLFTLTVISLPNILSNQSLYLELSQGSNLSLSCHSEGTPPLSYSWFYNADMLDTSIAVSSGESVEIANLSTTNSGMFQCFVDNSAGRDTRIFIVSVMDLTPQFISLQRDILAFIGDDFMFSCMAHGAPSLRYTFSLNNHSLLSLPSPDFVQHNDTHYSVIGATISHSGLYTCSVSNNVGDISHTFTVRVVDATVPYSLMNRTLTTFVNETVLLACRAILDPNYPSLELGYKWEHNGVDVNISIDGHFQLVGDYGDLQISWVVLADAGNYTCIAITSDANLTSSSYLETLIGYTEVIIPTDPDPPFDLDIIITNSTRVSISWYAPDNDGGVEIQSYTIEYLVNNSLPWELAGQSIVTNIMVSVCPENIYSFRVFAVNIVGSSEASSVSTGVNIPGVVPSFFPINLSAKSDLYRLLIDWKIPYSDTDCDRNIIDHSIKYQTPSMTSLRYISTGSSDLSFILTGLSPATYFTISVAFVNEIGIGIYSEYVSAETLHQLVAPSNFEVESYGIGSIAVYFIAPSTNASITGYKVLCYSLNGDLINRTLLPERASQLTVISDNISYDTNYTCSVLAFNSRGDGPASLTQTIIASERKVPNLPDSVTITTSGSYTATFAWVPSDDTTQFVLTLQYQYSLTPHKQRQSVFPIAHQSPRVIRELDAGVQYFVKLAGRNDHGIGFNRTSIFNLPPGRPGVPLLLASEELDVLFITWSIVHNGGSNITNITLETSKIDSTWNTVVTFEDNSASSYRLENFEKGSQIRIVISNSFGRTASTPVLFATPTEPVSPIVLIIIAVLIISTLALLLVLLILCGLFYFSYWRKHKKSRSLNISGNNEHDMEEESSIFRNLNNTSVSKKIEKFPARLSETSSECTENPPYHSRFASKDSRVSNGSKSSKSSSSSRRKVEIAERRQGPVAKGVLTQPGKIQSAKLPHKTVAFAEHSAQSSLDSDCTQPSSQISWTNSFNKQLRQSPNPINLEDYSPPLPPKRKGDSQPHPLSLTTNSYTNMFPRRNSDLWENGFEVTHPVNLISHKKSKSDELSDHYSTVFDIIPDHQSARIKSGGSSGKLNPNRSKHKVRSKSPITFLTQKLSPTKVRAPEIPKPILAPLPDIPSSSYDENTLANAMFTNIQGRIPSPAFFEHQHTDSVQSQQTSSLSSAC